MLCAGVSSGVSDSIGFTTVGDLSSSFSNSNGFSALTVKDCGWVCGREELTFFDGILVEIVDLARCFGVYNVSMKYHLSSSIQFLALL